MILMGSLCLWDLCSLWTLLMAIDAYGVSWLNGVPLVMGSLLTLDPIEGNRCLWGFLALWGPFAFGISAHSEPY